ncbi:hypothetical protein CL634_10770, partial [bacterium]|nr:hypothetical protein [bacterium]
EGGELGMGGDLAGPEGGLGGEEMPAEEEGPTAEEESALLAAPPPARRDDGSYTKPGWNGARYKPVAKTGGDRRKRGARKRHYDGQWSRETSKNTMRKTFPAAAELLGLGNGISEGKEPIYRKEERKLFEVHQEIKDLVAGMESKKNETKT